jgi:growth factor-regulated tyrosine kinase substrate
MLPRSARIEDDDDKDLKLALQMSLEEAKRNGIASPTPPVQAQQVQAATQPVVQSTDSEDEDLKAAIAASLKDMESKKTMQYPTLQQATQSAPTAAAYDATSPSLLSNQFQV